jgi:trypsin-like peptidase
MAEAKTIVATGLIQRPSLQSLYLQFLVNGSRLFTGTGFVATAPRGPVLITNRHLVTGRHQDTGECLSKTLGVPDEVGIFHNLKDKLASWIMCGEKLLTAEGEPLWFEHPIWGPKADFVALPLTQTDRVDLYPYTLGIGDPAIRVFPGDVVSVVGFPFGMLGAGALPLWVTGFVASEPVVNYNDLPIFIIDCRARSGQSGSAVIAYRSGGAVQLDDGQLVMFPGAASRFLGVYSGRISEQSDLGIVWKASAIQELVSSLI